jgi:hypothetical protein
LPSAELPDDPLAFIVDCVASGRVRWTYHVTMRLQQRDLTSGLLRESVSTLEIVETYAQDKYLPSFLLRGQASDFVFHAHIATDVEGNNVRVVTMYVPSPDEWEDSGRVRRNPR